VINITYNDVKVTREKRFAPPQGCELIAAVKYLGATRSFHEILIIDEHQSEWRVWTAQFETREACDIGLCLYQNQETDWHANCSKAGLAH
jgi:hypothetical protein